MQQSYSIRSGKFPGGSYSEGQAHLQRFRPCPVLRLYVEVIWVQELSGRIGISTQSPTTILPTGIPDLLF